MTIGTTIAVYPSAKRGRSFYELSFVQAARWRPLHAIFLSKGAKMNGAETLVYVVANSAASYPVRSGCTMLLMSEDRELRPHAVEESLAYCGPEQSRCGAAPKTCVGRRPACLANITSV